MTRPAYSVCLCPDSRLLKNRLDSLLAVHTPAQGGAWQRFVFWGDEGITASFWEHLTLQGLFATPKALVVRNAQALTADALKPLSAALAPLAKAPSPLIWPLVCFEVGMEKGKPKLPAHITNLALYTEAEHKGWLDITPALTPATLPAFIRTEAQSHGLILGREDVALLAQSLTPDASSVGNEIARLALLADANGKLPQRLAQLIGGQAQEIGIFELMRMVQQNSRSHEVWRRILEDRLSGDNLVFAFSAILLREARILWQCLAGTPPYLPPQAQMQKKIAAEALGFAGIAKLWDLALAADKGIKSGERSPDQAFEALTAGVFMLFGGKRLS